MKEILECKYCKNSIVLGDSRRPENFKNPELYGWTLIGFGIWHCPDCDTNRETDYHDLEEKFNSIGIKHKNRNRAIPSKNRG